MRFRPLFLVGCLLFALTAEAAVPVLVIHGGAGVVKSELTPEKEKLVRADLQRALEAGYGVLKSGGSSLDAVGKAIVVLEDSPRFNAGKGAVFTHDGKNELDAAIMDGATLRAGAIAAVHRVKNPILLARAVMEKSEHVFLVGDGAEVFARTAGIELVDPKYFYTEERWQALQSALREEREKKAEPGKTPHHGTVGAVALDTQGAPRRRHLDRRHDQQALGPRRRFADHRRRHLRRRALRGVGHRLGRVLHPRHRRARHLRAVEYAKTPVADAARQVVMDVIPKLGGDGGVIALDSDGNFATPFNTDGMYRGWVDKDGKVHVAILGD